MQGLLLCDLRDPAPAVRLARERGLGVELQYFYYPQALDEPARALAEHRVLLAGLAGPRAIHGPFIGLSAGCLDPLVREVTRRRLLEGLAIAGKLGAGHMVTHLGYIPHNGPQEEWLALAADFWRTLLPEVPEGIRIYLENMLEEGPEMQLALAERVGDPRLGLCLDLGHAHALSRRPVVEWIEALGERLAYVHLHDNRGAEDEHLPLGRGNLPLAEALAALERRAPRAIWALEAGAAPSLAWLQANGFLAP